MKSKLLIIIALICFGCEKSLPLQNNLLTSDDLVIHEDTLIVDTEDTLIVDTEVELSYQLGRDIYKFSCAACHLSPDGRDIIMFGSSDPIELADSIISRSLGHVQLDSAKQIEFYLSQLQYELGITPNNNAPVIPTPVGDIPTAVWSGQELSTELIESWNFKNIEVSFDSPRWFDNKSNLDWIPGDTISSFGRGEVRNRFQEYLDDPSLARLESLIIEADQNLTQGERHPGEYDYWDFKTSFENARWLSVLYMQHVFSNPSVNIEDSEIGIDMLWRPGDIARRSGTGDLTGELDNRVLNGISWMYYSWLYDEGYKRGDFESSYLCNDLHEYGLTHLALLVNLKNLVTRGPNTRDPFWDLAHLVNMNYQPGELYYQSVSFGIEYILDRLNNDYENIRLNENDKQEITKAFNDDRVLMNIPGALISEEQKQELHDRLLSIISLL